MRPGSAQPVIPRSGRFWLLAVLFCTLMGLLNFGVIITERAASGYPVEWQHYLLLELDGTFSLLPLIPFLIWFISRYPLQWNNWWLRFPAHFFASIVFGVSHTLLMWGSRLMLWRLAGWGPFDYGLMKYRFPMEYQKQIIMYCLVYGAVRFADYVKRNQETLLSASELERKLSEARLHALKAQLNPHFLFNTLNMISSYIYEDPQLADAMIGHLSDFLRVTLRHSDVHQIALEQEIEMVESYLAIMQARFEDQLQVELDIPERLRGQMVPHLLLQPLVENSITYCSTDHSRQCIVTIRAEENNDRLSLIIEDNGPGIDGNENEAVGRGIGLSNVAERLEELYPGDHEFQLFNLEEGGLRITINLPQKGQEAS